MHMIYLKIWKSGNKKARLDIASNHVQFWNKILWTDETINQFITQWWEFGEGKQGIMI